MAAAGHVRARFNVRTYRYCGKRLGLPINTPSHSIIYEIYIKGKYIHNVNRLNRSHQPGGIDYALGGGAMVDVAS